MSDRRGQHPGNVAAGNGIYKSEDGGTSWTQVWKQEGQIGTIAVHPRNPEVAFAAVLGHAFGPNAERGVINPRRRKTRQQVLKKDADTGAMTWPSTSNPSACLAGLGRPPALGHDQRRPGSGPTSPGTAARPGARNHENGLPEGIWGSTAWPSPSDSRRVYALIEAEKGGLFR
jgi:hypothetical protein